MSEETKKLKAEIKALRTQLAQLQQRHENYYVSSAAQHNWLGNMQIPETGHASKTVKTIIENTHTLDFNQQLNTSSYVNVSFEEDEEAVALMGLRVNLADQTVYPQSYKMHNSVVNMIARLWHCPEPEDFSEYGTYPGAGTVGSTEACLLAGLALKFRWRAWYAKRNNLNTEEVLAIRPNLVISTCFQAAWEKLLKYMDIEPKFIQPSVENFTLCPQKVRNAIDEKTIGVVCIMGNHYAGQYDPVWEIDQVIEEINTEQSYQVGIHVDAASGGFIAPFQRDLPPWDFRLKNVLSISSSGHKYGESCCGTGWIIWRQRKNLSEHIAISVTYLGGKADSYTLNFSRPASGVYVQYYKFLRYGQKGYQTCCDNMMQNAKFLRDGLKSMTYKGIPRFILLDHGDKHCLPVVSAMLNPACNFSYDDIDLQHVLSQHHWYVSGYQMSFDHPLTEEKTPLLYDEQATQTMFRIVVKNNLTRDLAEHLLRSFQAAFEFLDSINDSEQPGLKMHKIRHIDQRKPATHC
ncbi:glutamate decarboxylase beta-like [Ylistrum balloti]|uniref:glutamate decarboxylase beta-like n=1 Tax=Ylistrum balloti TaxID=509963 RepID=UPI002905C9E3|nr:glutamate decarboxylase beta-like [Ylistrum balloti]